MPAMEKKAICRWPGRSEKKRTLKVAMVVTPLKSTGPDISATISPE